MFSLISAFILSLASYALAQNQVIKVGATANEQGGIFQFIPNNINATNGSTITFEFTGAPGNHSITQSLFTDPCNPISNGFDSGWVLIPDPSVIATTVPTWNLTITNSTQPIWFFCKQLVPSPHCHAGMVGGINVPATGANTFSAFQKNAQGAQGNSGQGQGPLVGLGASASALPNPIPSGATLFTGVPVPSGSATQSSGAPGTSTTTNSAVSGFTANLYISAFTAVVGLFILV